MIITILISSVRNPTKIPFILTLMQYSRLNMGILCDPDFKSACFEYKIDEETGMEEMSAQVEYIFRRFNDGWEVAENPNITK